MPRRYGFRAASLDDLPMLRRWLAVPEVARWWGADDPFDAEALAGTRHWPHIVSLDGTPFAYIQHYDPQGWPDHPFRHLPPGSRGIDQFIGLPDLLGQGHGPGFIRQHMATLYAAGAPVICTDPHPDNARAIAAYRKCGFEVVGAPRDTPWGRILPMEAPA
ncbi:GNAT family N-acetyltransferase [Vannielia litorea]|uniref:GNAT family N-acetyltransferase n=1 Tax=Vannielia litorea TaxID=1217970 RepID=UPI001BCAF1BB|nr:GNAT family N-acetyltransferase [Vannielia litorea]MBS8225552.1 N-acetyltransferase [Vannielia litorea]